MASQEENTKLADVKKFKLIYFYRENPDWWVTNQGVSRTKKLLKKEKLVKEFDGKFSTEILEKVFHGLRASYLWEHKKYKDGNLPKNQKRHGSFVRVYCSLVKMVQCRKLFSPLKRERFWWHFTKLTLHYGTMEWLSIAIEICVVPYFKTCFRVWREILWGRNKKKSGIFFQHTPNEKNKRSSYQSRQGQVQTRFLNQIWSI